jgi:hypothetical protein
MESDGRSTTRRDNRMTFATNVIAGLGLIGGVNLATLAPAAAATAPAGSNGSNVSAPKSNAPSTGNPVHQAHGPMLLHRVAVLQEAMKVGA